MTASVAFGVFVGLQGLYRAGPHDIAAAVRHSAIHGF